MCSMPGDLHLPTGDLLPSPTAAQGSTVYLLSARANTNTHTPHDSGGEARARVHLEPVQMNTRVHCLLAAPVCMKNVYLVQVDHMSHSCPTSHSVWAPQWPSPQLYWWQPPALVHMVLAQLLTVLAEIRDAGTPHRKEPVGYDEAGPSGPLWGPVRLTCATCFQVALS